MNQQITSLIRMKAFQQDLSKVLDEYESSVFHVSMSSSDTLIASLAFNTKRQLEHAHESLAELVGILNFYSPTKDTQETP